MSSAITTAYDNLLTRIAAVLTANDGWLQIPNAYDVASNSDSFLKQGYGIKIGSGVNAKRQLGNQMHIDRKFSLIISREVCATDGDTSTYGSVAKQLFEDLKLVINDFETNTTLNSGLIFCSYESDGGVQPVRGDNYSVVYVSAEFTTILIENLGG
jgi:hypothetical protein